MRALFSIALLSASVGLAATHGSPSLGSATAPRYITFSATIPAPPALAGARVKQVCENKVVQCNWVKYYMGNIAWRHSIVAPGSERYENVTVTVDNFGNTTCKGGVRELENGRTTTGNIAGNGLIGIQFMLDSANKLVYRIIGACPTASGMGSPVQPADVDQNSMETYEQPAEKQAQDSLVGSSIYPAPETDPLNKVTGQVQTSWRFYKKL